MMSCETKESFRGIEKHLEIDHPDLFVLYKRDLQGKILLNFVTTWKDRSTVVPQAALFL